MTGSSPYEHAVGARVAELHPRLRAYFQAVPAGRVGIGEGVFTRIGCADPLTRRVLSSVLRLLQARGAVFGGWAENVPFTVRNRGIDDAAGVRVATERVLHMPEGAWTMSDLVHALPGGRIGDRLGLPAVLGAVFDVRVADGALELHSTRAGLRICGLRIRIPACLAPRIRLRESFDDALDRQRVELSVDLPVPGRIHEYAGTFVYRIEADR